MLGEVGSINGTDVCSLVINGHHGSYSEDKDSKSLSLADKDFQISAQACLSNFQQNQLNVFRRSPAVIFCL